MLKNLLQSIHHRIRRALADQWNICVSVCVCAPICVYSIQYISYICMYSMYSRSRAHSIEIHSETKARKHHPNTIHPSCAFTTPHEALSVEQIFECSHSHTYNTHTHTYHRRTNTFNTGPLCTLLIGGTHLPNISSRGCVRVTECKAGRSKSTTLMIRG